MSQQNNVLTECAKIVSENTRRCRPWLATGAPAMNGPTSRVWEIFVANGAVIIPKCMAANDVSFQLGDFLEFPVAA
jgi:hypothetical protein